MNKQMKILKNQNYELEANWKQESTDSLHDLRMCLNAHFLAHLQKDHIDICDQIKAMKLLINAELKARKDNHLPVTDGEQHNY